MPIRMEKLGMTQYSLIRKDFLVNARRYFLASDTLTEAKQRRGTCTHQHPTARVIIRAPARFMGTAA